MLMRCIFEYFQKKERKYKGTLLRENLECIEFFSFKMAQKTC